MWVGKNREVDSRVLRFYAYEFKSCVHRTLKTKVPVMEGMLRRSNTFGDTNGGGKGYALEKVGESKLCLKVPTLFFSQILQTSL